MQLYLKAANSAAENYNQVAAMIDLLSSAESSAVRLSAELVECAEIHPSFVGLDKVVVAHSSFGSDENSQSGQKAAQVDAK